MPPWVATPASGDFLAYDGLVKTLAYKTTAPDTWTVSDVVNNNAVRTLAADAAVHALKATSDLTIPADLTLTNASGGLILIGKALHGNGTFAAGTNDLVVYETGTSAIYPRISANGLTAWGGGTPSVSNITWSGDTYVHQGVLKSIIAENTVLDGRSINGDVFIDLDALPESGVALVAQGDLALGGASVLHLSGAPVDGQVLITCDGELSGRLAISGLPGAYTLAYGAEGPGTVSILHSPTVFVVR